MFVCDMKVVGAIPVLLRWLVVSKPKYWMTYLPRSNQSDEGQLKRHRRHLGVEYFCVI